ncbi:MAG: RNA 2',3'-cyclic phosphodiesterase [Gammaproteobacteria bacterium]|nr:RNA 2',3'-cyclic phosphodiesterase [Gammaproteobacteria bacterium]
MPRLFFALLPDQHVRQRLHATIPGAQTGQPITASNLHLTLHFIGQTQALFCLTRQAEKIRCHAFSLSIDQYGYFNRAKVLWAGPTKHHAQLSQLATQCALATQRCGINKIPEHYTPHVSLVRKIGEKTTLPEFTPIQWPVNSFYLMLSESSQNGVKYKIAKKFDLRNED